MAALGGAIAGVGRALQDERRLSMQEDESKLRRRALEGQISESEELRPLRRRAIEAQTEHAEKQLTVDDLNIDIAQMTKEEKKRTNQLLADAQKKELAIKKGLGTFHASGNPQSVADAFAQIFPEQSGLTAEGTHEFKATRTDSGSIILTGPNGTQTVLKGGKTKEGRAYGPDDELAMLAYKVFNPLEQLKNQLAHQYKLEEADVRANAQTEAARIRAEQAAAAATTRAGRTQAVADDRGIRLGKSFVDSSLKTTSIPGHFQNVYSSEDDAKLTSHIYDSMGAKVRSGVEPEKAAKDAITETRTEFATAKREALDAAAALAKAKINPKDAAAVQAAKEKGDKSADALMQAIGRIRRKYGPDIAKYLFDQIQGTKK